MIYKKYIFGHISPICLVFVHSSWPTALKTLKISRDKRIKVSFVMLMMTFRKPLGNLRLVARRINPMIRVGTFSPPSHISGEEKGAEDWVQLPMANDIIKHAYVMKPWSYFKNKKLGTLRLGRMTCPDCTRGGHRSSESSLLLDPALCISSIWLFLSYVLYHKTVVSRTAFQWVQELFHRIIKTEERGVMGNPKSVAKLDNSVGILGSPLAAGDKIKAV